MFTHRTRTLSKSMSSTEVQVGTVLSSCSLGITNRGDLWTRFHHYRARSAEAGFQQQRQQEVATDVETRPFGYPERRVPSRVGAKRGPLFDKRERQIAVSTRKHRAFRTTTSEKAPQAGWTERPVSFYSHRCPPV